MKYTIALVGNPNSGKTTLFNALTGSSQRIGNWPGVTVDLVEGARKEEDDTFLFVDLPGIYGLSAKTDDERVSRNFLNTGKFDLAVNILDSTNIERNLYLTTQLMEMGIPCLMVLNMHDLAEEQGLSIDNRHLSTHLGFPSVKVSATSPDAVSTMMKEIRGALNRESAGSKRVVRYPNEVEDLISKWTAGLRMQVLKIPVPAGLRSSFLKRMKSLPPGL